MDYIQEQPRKTPVSHRADVFVIGGGPADLAAAIAASRNGMDTLLVERYGFLGGMLSGELLREVHGTFHSDSPLEAAINGGCCRSVQKRNGEQAKDRGRSAPLYEQIGRLKMEVDWLRKKL